MVNARIGVHVNLSPFNASSDRLYAARALRRSWIRLALERLQEGITGHCGFAVSKSDVARMNEVHLAYVCQVQNIIADSSAPDCVDLYCKQLVDMHKSSSEPTVSLRGPELLLSSYLTSRAWREMAHHLLATFATRSQLVEVLQKPRKRGRENGTKVNVKMQLTRPKARETDYACIAYSNQLEGGADYGDSKPAIAIIWLVEPTPSWQTQ